MRFKVSRPVAAVGAVLLTLVGAVAAFAAKPPMMSVDTGAKLSVIGPANGAVVTGNTVDVAVNISDFKLSCALAGTPNRKGVGHYHVELDHSLINMFCDSKAPISMQNVALGKHTLAFIPTANDHAEDMKAMKMVTFTYKPAKALPPVLPLSFPDKPSIEIVSPKPGTTVHGAFDLVVAVKKFKLSCDLYGKADVKGYGHWHANVDSTTMGMMGMATMLRMSCANTFHVSLDGISRGQHRFFAILVDNTHAPTIGAAAGVTVKVS